MSKRNVAYFTLLCVASTLLAGLALRTTAANTPSESETAIWKLEHDYWNSVQQNNLTAYRNLWDKDFLGWPSTSPVPLPKDHITDWITMHTSKGESLQLLDFKEAAIHTNGDVIVACYWATSKWVDKDGKGNPATLRILHTWRKSADGWHIISGMSMPGEPPQN